MIILFLLFLFFLLVSYCNKSKYNSLLNKKSKKISGNPYYTNISILLSDNFLTVESQSSSQSAQFFVKSANKKYMNLITSAALMIKKYYHSLFIRQSFLYYQWCRLCIIKIFTFIPHKLIWKRHLISFQKLHICLFT